MQPTNPIVAMDGHHPMDADRLKQYDHEELLRSGPGNPDNCEFYPGEEAALNEPSL